MAKTTKTAGKTKLAIVTGLLTRAKGCTRADVLEATGWPSVSVQQQAAAAGLTLRSEKDGPVLRYYGAGKAPAKAKAKAAKSAKAAKPAKAKAKAKPAPASEPTTAAA
jgi:hypothetical protein